MLTLPEWIILCVFHQNKKQKIPCVTDTLLRILSGVVWCEWHPLEDSNKNKRRERERERERARRWLLRFWFLCWWTIWRVSYAILFVQAKWVLREVCSLSIWLRIDFLLHFFYFWFWVLVWVSLQLWFLTYFLR